MTSLTHLKKAGRGTASQGVRDRIGDIQFGLELDNLNLAFGGNNRLVWPSNTSWTSMSSARAHWIITRICNLLTYLSLSICRVILKNIRFCSWNDFLLFESYSYLERFKKKCNKMQVFSFILCITNDFSLSFFFFLFFIWPHQFFF